tara:strand:- start:114 stop:500 length:387 start_codon:yes stop_codon:yes gene_type:complete
MRALLFLILLSTNLYARDLFITDKELFYWNKESEKSIACKCIEAVPGECKVRIETLSFDFENKNLFKLNKPLLIWDFLEFEIQNISETQLNAKLKTQEIYLSKKFNEYELLYINSDPNGYRKFICILT